MLSFLTKQADELTGPIDAVGNVLGALFTSDKERFDKDLAWCCRVELNHRPLHYQ